jgi:hypothetical protein
VCTTRCVPFGSGESFFVPNAETLPQLTTKKTDLPPAQPNENQPALIAGNQVGPDGSPTGLLLTGTQTNMTVADNGDGLLVYSGQTVVFDSSGVPQSIGGSTLPPLTDVGNDGFIAWGREATSAFGYYFVTGPSMLGSDLAQVEKSLPVATYTLLGGTKPISDSGALGELVGGSLTAYFATRKVDASLTLKMDGAVLDLASKGMVINPGTTAVTFGSGSCTLAGGTCQMEGFFAGPNANRAGVVYEASSGQSAAAAAVTEPRVLSARGAAAFIQAR